MLFFSLLVFPFVASFFVYSDLKRFRGRGVRVNPGLIAGLLLFGYYAFSIIFSVSRLLHSLPYALQSSVFPFLPLLLLLIFGGIYAFLRINYKKIAAQNNPPLPPSSLSRVLFLLAVLLVPILVFVGLIWAFMSAF